MPVNAQDNVIVAGEGDAKNIPMVLKQNVELIHTLTLNELISVADLAAVLLAVSKHEPAYDPLRTQCFWFTWAIYKCVKRKYPGSGRESGPAHWKRGKCKT
jgi:hypothetical protein